MKKLLLFLILTAVLTACEDHFISSPLLLKEVNRDFDTKMEALDGHFDYGQALSGCATTAQKEAMKFLYAYMPLGDIADYDYTLYLDGIRYAFRVREEMPWGASVPEDVFRHFVLPLRVNNENLDRSREVFFEELKGRVSGLSMYDAALEVNHWCHEKVIYTPSDGRTSAPLASVRTAYGRCGEESVFTAAALRSVGIPARQVYTPRWAHTDDNHAWVEVWVDGTWYYMGACEPEAKLNVAWFSSTAQRALLMHTKVFGKYHGNEDIISTTDCYTEINVTSNYAPTRRLEVVVTDADGNAESGAKVEFKIYNYAEFYSAITSFTDEHGAASATFGLGDVVVWASKEGKFGYRKVSVGSAEMPVRIPLEMSVGEPKYEEIDIVPPVEAKAAVTLSQEEAEANAVRLAAEDSIRNAYVATFDRSTKYLEAARGNWKEISTYISNLQPEEMECGMKLLDLVSAKDLRDTPSEVLFDHLRGYDGSTEELSIRYILNPRIANELLTPWRSLFQNEIASGTFGTTPLSPENIIKFTTTIKLADNLNPQTIPISPIGVLKLRAADRLSRELFFIALCRSANIPARIEEVSGKLQYFSDGIWHDVLLDSAGQTAVAPAGKLTISYAGQNYIDDPKFETHFTVAKIVDCALNTLNFRDKEGYEGTVSWKSISKEPITLDTGYYMLTTGTRMASGKVLSTMTFFNIAEGDTTDIALIMREDSTDLQVIGAMNAESLFQLITPSGEKQQLSILQHTGRGFFVLGFLKANQEPTNHAIRSLFEKSPAVPTILFFGTEKEYGYYLKDHFPTPPEGIAFGIDEGGSILEAISKEMKINKVEYPLFIIADTFGRIVFLSEGYNIGTAEQLGKIRK